MSITNNFGIAIAGLGTVGSGVAKILSEHQVGDQGLFLKSILERDPEKDLPGNGSKKFQRLLSTIKKPSYKIQKSR